MHYRVTNETDRRIEAGTMFLIDSGAQYINGTTDITRTVAIGAVPEEQKRFFTLVLKGMIAISTARFRRGHAASTSIRSPGSRYGRRAPIMRTGPATVSAPISRSTKDRSALPGLPRRNCCPA